MFLSIFWNIWCIYCSWWYSSNKRIFFWDLANETAGNSPEKGCLSGLSSSVPFASSPGASYPEVTCGQTLVLQHPQNSTPRKGTDIQIFKTENNEVQQTLLYLSSDFLFWFSSNIDEVEYQHYHLYRSQHDILDTQLQEENNPDNPKHECHIHIANPLYCHII